MVSRKYQTLLLSILGIVILLAVLLTRTLGIHIDENVYLAQARDAALGDGPSSGKIYGFNLFNYLIYHGLGPIFGSLRPLCLHMTYIALGSAALARFVKRLAPEAVQAWCFALILLAPFTLFNETQLMTETPMLILILVILGSLLDLTKFQSKSSHIVIFLAGMILVVFKDSGVIPLIALAIVFYPSLKKDIGSTVAGAILGFALNRIMLSLVHAPNYYQNSVSISFFGLAHFMERLKSIGVYAWMWCFYLWPPLMAAAIYSLRNNIDLRDRLFLRMIAGSMIATLLINFLSAESFVRYCYPIVWLGLIACAALASRLKPVVLVLIVLSYAVPAAALWGHSPNRMTLWPEVISSEAYHSGFTILPGTPIHSWVFVSGDKRKNMCIFIPTRSAENAWAVMHYFRTISENPRFFNEASEREFQQCDGPKAVLRRQYQQDPAQCWPDCPADMFRLSNCTLQDMRGWAARAGILTNRTCLP